MQASEIGRAKVRQGEGAREAEFTARTDAGGGRSGRTGEKAVKARTERRRKVSGRECDEVLITPHSVILTQ